jgi:hypothetical protein
MDERRLKTRVLSALIGVHQQLKVVFQQPHWTSYQTPECNGGGEAETLHVGKAVEILASDRIKNCVNVCCHRTSKGAH